MKILTENEHLLLFGVVDPRAGFAPVESGEASELIYHWIDALFDAGIRLDWPADTTLIDPLTTDPAQDDDVLGIPIAGAGDWPGDDRFPLPWLAYTPPDDDASPLEAALALRNACAGLVADIATAIQRWEIARLTARAIGLNLDAGRLYLLCRHVADTMEAVHAATV